MPRFYENADYKETTMPHPVDVHVGQTIRNTRRARALTQQTLAAQVGVKFQQIQKYETGANRVSASRLWEIAQVLDVPVSHFFDGYEASAAKADRRSA
jgi:transcriptional regulator with XRE-family HTH domain